MELSLSGVERSRLVLESIKGLLLFSISKFSQNFSAWVLEKCFHCLAIESEFHCLANELMADSMQYDYQTSGGFFLPSSMSAMAAVLNLYHSYQSIYTSSCCRRRQSAAELKCGQIDPLKPEDGP